MSMRILILLLSALVPLACQNTANTNSYPTNDYAYPAYSDPVDEGPEPGTGHYLSVSINGEECVDAGTENEIRVLAPASEVRGSFSVKYGLDKSVLGQFKRAELIMFAYQGNSPDMSSFYLVESDAAFAPEVEHLICGPDTTVEYHTGSGSSVIETLPTGRYRLELTVDGQEERDRLYLDVRVLPEEPSPSE